MPWFKYPAGIGERIMRLDSIDFIKGMAIIGVIACHTFADVGIITPIIRQVIPVFLILMGVNLANSFNTKGFHPKEYLMNRASRFLIPLIPLYIIAFYLAIKNVDIIRFYTSNPIYILGQFPGAIQGNYFIGIVIQTILVIPILWWLGKKNMKAMITGAFAVSAVSEIIFAYFGIPGLSFTSDYLYETLILRWLFHIALGVAVSQMIFERKPVPAYLVSAIVITTAFSLSVFISGFGYIKEGFSNMSCITALYALGLILIAVYGNISWKPIDYLGKASWHIFLVNVLFVDFYGYHGGNILNDLIINLCIGIIFFQTDNYIHQWAASKKISDIKYVPVKIMNTARAIICLF